MSTKESLKADMCRRKAVTATVVALMLLLAGGAGYELLSARYARASTSVPIPSGSLAKLPLHIGNWVGEDVPLDEQIIRATDTDDHVNRAYARSGSRGSVGMWLAYGVQFRDLMPHRPDVCYPGGGWTLEQAQLVELELEDGSAMPCQIFQFTRGVLRDERIAVLNYYLLDGQFSADVSALRKRIWRFNNDLKYVVQVQVTCSQDPFGRNPEKLIRQFGAESALVIRDTVTQAVAESAHLSAARNHGARPRSSSIRGG